MRDVLPLDFTLLHPEILWALLLLPLIWWRPGTRPGVLQRVLRTTVFACIALALAQPSLLLRRPGAAQMVVLDMRSGVATDAALRRFLSRVDARDRITLITLGGTSSEQDSRIAARIALPAGALSTGLQRALAELPPGAAGAVTVIGDGRSRDAHWDRAVDGLLRRGVPVSAIATDPGEPAAFLADLRVPPVRVGEIAQASLTIAGRGENLVVQLLANDREVARSEPFAVDGETRLDLRFPADQAGFLPLRARLIQGQATPPLATMHSVAAVQNPLPLLYLGNRQQGAAPRLQALVGSAFAVDARSPGSLGTAFDFTDYAAVMVDDVPAAMMPAPLQARLIDAVAHQGTGLFYSGGAQAFGMGGYSGTPLAAALPVALRQEDKLEQPSVALVIVIDTSGSMVGTPLDLAKQVARFAVRKLGPMDSIGVVEFYGAKQWAVPLQPARDTAEAERAIGRMQAQGSSILFPAIQEAYYALKGSAARFKHILVISDAGVEEQRYQALLTHIADDRINVSTALVGADPQGEERMVQWARWGRGRYYGVPDEFSMVELNLKQPQDKPAPGYRSGTVALSSPADQPRWQGVSMRGVPPLAGFVPAGKRPDAETLLATPDGDPVLATWQYGAGRITALTTEPLGAGTAAWSRWPGYGQWLGSILARTASPEPKATLTLARRLDAVTVTFRQSAGSGGAPVVRFLAPGGQAIGAPLPLVERAPGLFTGERRFDPARPALVEARRGALVLRAADRAESDIGGNDRLPLATLARLTGGVFAEGATAPFQPPRPGGATLIAVALGGWFALLALATYLAEIVHRRWPKRRRTA